MTTTTSPAGTEPKSFTSYLITTFTSPISSLPNSTPTPTPTPLYAPADVPSIKKAQRRTGNTRMKQLLRAADRAHDDPPPPPELGDCCGSSCDPCVKDLWKEELGCWRERWGEGGVGGKKEEKGMKGEGEERRRMPGAFDW